jgi:hypothetical protein
MRIYFTSTHYNNKQALKTLQVLTSEHEANGRLVNESSTIIKVIVPVLNAHCKASPYIVEQVRSFFATF